MSNSASSVRRDALDQRRQKIDAEAHVAGLDDPGTAAGGGDDCLLLRRKAGGADDVNEAAARRLRGEEHGRRGNGEVENAVGLGEQRLDLVGHQDAVHAEAGQFAGVAPDRGGAGRFRGADEDGPFAVGNSLDQGAAHPPPGTGHDQPHRGHEFLPIRRGYSGTRHDCKASRDPSDREHAGPNRLILRMILPGSLRFFAIMRSRMHMISFKKSATFRDHAVFAAFFRDQRGYGCAPS